MQITIISGDEAIQMLGSIEDRSTADTGCNHIHIGTHHSFGSVVLIVDSMGGAALLHEASSD